MRNEIYQLRHIELDPSDAAKLWPFTQAYRPHDPVPSWREFKADGIDKIEEESLLEVIIDQYDSEQ
jgi:hypothetical protein